MTATVHTQAELNAAVAAAEPHIIIDSLAGVWLTLRSDPTKSTVEAWESSQVVARGSSHVEARGSSTVVAGSHVAVHLHSAHATISGGVIIDLTTLDLEDPATWLAYHGVTVADGKVAVYKAVDGDLQAGHGYTLTAYPIGETVTADDWADSRMCGQGLHFGVSPSQARAYYGGDGKPRFLAVEVDVETLIPLGDKCKAAACRVLHEVDLHGDRVDAQAVSA